MKKFEKLKAKNKAIMTNVKKDTEKISTLADEYRRVSYVARDAEIILDDIDKQFAQATKLNKLDVSFLFLATALQCARQYLLTDFKEPLKDKDAGKKHEKYRGDRVNRGNKWYNPSLEEIMVNPVPYDASFGSPKFKLGLGGQVHRIKTLGHDPILGWIFGTANILTSTLTTYNLKSYHVKTGYTKSGARRDKMSNNANTELVFEYCKKRVLEEGIEGKTKMGMALIRQAEHLNSDKYTKMSLPVPIISSISPELSLKITKMGIKASTISTVTSQVSYAILINVLIGMIHALFYNSDKDRSEDLYEVRTRKILSYSNLIASASNILYVALSGDKKKADIGGWLVTLHRLVSDYKFQRQVKEEFLEKEFYKIVMGADYNL